MHPLIFVPRRRMLTPGEILGAGRVPRGADGLGCGVGCGTWRGGSPLWTPASLPSLAAWYEAVDVDATLVKAVQPTIDTAAANWTASSANVSTSDSATVPPGGSGTSLKIDFATTGTHYVYQLNKLIVGNRYRADTELICDLAEGLRATDGTTVPVWWNSATTSWLSVTGEDTAQAAAVLLYRTAGSASTSSLVYNPKWTNLSRTRWNPTTGSLGGYRATATPANQPWASSVAGRASLRFADTDILPSSVAAASYKFLHYTAGGTYDAPVFTVGYAINIPTLSANHMIDNTPGSPGYKCFVASNGSVKVEITDAGAGLIHPTCATAAGKVTNGTSAVIVVVSDGTNLKIRVNGVEEASVAFDSAAANADPAATRAIGASAAGTNCLLGHIFEDLLYTEALSGSDLTNVELELAA